MIQTATDQFSPRHKGRNSTCRNATNSRISTAGAADTGSRALKFQDQFPAQPTDRDSKEEERS